MPPGCLPPDLPRPWAPRAQRDILPGSGGTLPLQAGAVCGRMLKKGRSFPRKLRFPKGGYIYGRADSQRTGAAAVRRGRGGIFSGAAEAGQAAAGASGGVPPGCRQRRLRRRRADGRELSLWHRRRAERPGAGFLLVQPVRPGRSRGSVLAGCVL